MKSGPASAALKVHSSGSDVGDSIRVLGWFDGAGRNKIESVEFASGTVWTAADIDAFIASGQALPLATRARPLEVAGLADAIAAFVGSAEEDAAVQARQRVWLPIGLAAQEGLPRP